MQSPGLTINAQDYFEMPGLNVLVYHNTFLEGHQGGIEIIQHGERVATNGELRLSPAPGQWQPVPKFGEGFESRGVSPMTIGFESRSVDRENQTISMPCSYPDESRHRKGFNPLIYPDLNIRYTVRVKAEGQSFTITVDLAQPLPPEWVGRVGYSLELFPGDLYGKTYYMDEQPGIFPRQANGPTFRNADGEAEALPLAEGKRLVVAPESERLRMQIDSLRGPVQLLDGSLKHNNGWFVVHSLVAGGATEQAVQWCITPNVIPDWKDEPVVHISQVGYHPKQKKVAYVELDGNEQELLPVTVLRVDPAGEVQPVLQKKPVAWGKYFRYQYALLDFSEIQAPGIYMVKYGGFTTNPFQIDEKVYKRHVWQPTLEYFMPMQMCHMRINQKYRVWHGLCHMDDALMAPPNIDHFDGYNNTDEPAGSAPFASLEHIAGLAAGGWHDAGDDDIRTDTQISTIMALALSYEAFDLQYDETYIDQQHRHVEIHHPDGKPDALQQIEHGVIWILNFYRKFGSLGVGVIVPTLRQYVHLGDPAAQTDNCVVDDDALKAKAASIDKLWYKRVANRFSAAFDPEENLNEIEVVVPGLDDRLAFAQVNPKRQLYVAAGLALAARVLKGYNPALAEECLAVAEALWAEHHAVPNEPSDIVHAHAWWANIDTFKVHALAELILTTDKQEYKDALYALADTVGEYFEVVGWTLGRVLPHLDRAEFIERVSQAARAYQPRLEQRMAESPFGCPLFHTEIVGFVQYFLHKGWPEIFSADPLFAVMNFLLGCRPGRTTNSLVSGVGVNSPVVAYGFSRADWSYTPGGTFWNAVNLVRPDLPEDKVWPYLWQEREYITNTACMFMFTVLAADRLLQAE